MSPQHCEADGLGHVKQAELTGRRIWLNPAELLASVTPLHPV